MRGRIAALGLCAALCLSLPGCSTAKSQITRHNAGLYVQGVLDETYSGEPEEAYLTLTGRTGEDAQAAFSENLQAEYDQRLCARFELEDEYVPRALRRDFLELLDQVYRKAGYAVKSATPLEDGRYCVELSVTPVTFFSAAYADGYDRLRRDFEDESGYLTDQELDALEPVEARKARQEREAAWAQAVYDNLLLRLDNINTGSAVYKLVLVSPDSQGLYSLSATDRQDVDDLILQY